MRRAAFVVACMTAACGSRATPSNTTPPEAGISIALYRSGGVSYGVVDDRRWVEISGSTILLANIDPGASLASLVLETANPDVRIGPCTRQRLPDASDLPPDPTDAFMQARVERIRAARREYEDQIPRRYRSPVTPQAEPGKPVEKFAPIVQCEVAGAPGKYLVRILYVSITLGYRVQHDIAIRDATKATIESRFAIKTPHWRTRAELVVFDGLPGSVEPPREITRGHTTLDGGTSVLIVGAREVPALLRRVFEGQPFDAFADNHEVYSNQVWSTLEIPNLRLVPGPIRAHVELDGEDRWIDIPAAEPTKGDKPDDDKEPFRIKLWIDDALRGKRERTIIENDGLRLIEVVTLTMSNRGDTAREVWLEEHARPAKRRQIDRPWPKKPSASGNTIRYKVVVNPGRVERVGYTIIYEL